jgi:hypothetical protein
MEAVEGGGIRNQSLPATGLTPPQLETYEVPVHA